MLWFAEAGRAGQMAFMGNEKDASEKDASFIHAIYLLKQSLQYTGRSLRGSKGTLQGFPHSAHTASYICRVLFSREYPLRASRQGLQRCGSFVKPFSA
jgi:hypothetical protein